MGDASKGLNPSELKAILEKLDEVLVEAGRLRLQIELQMKEQRMQQRLKITHKLTRVRRLRRTRSS